MQVVVQIPDELAAQLPPVEKMPRELVEAYAAEGYRAERLSPREVSLLLGLDRWQTEQFLSQRGAIRPYNSSDFELEQSSVGQR
jgi:predicted HTH domain antitoxin